LNSSLKDINKKHRKNTIPEHKKQIDFLYWIYRVSSGWKGKGA